MHARKWLSNSPALLGKIPEADRVEIVDLDTRELPAVKTLGIVWDVRADKFTFKFMSFGNTRRKWRHYSIRWVFCYRLQYGLKL